MNNYPAAKKVKIVSSLNSSIEHRVGITNCPHCDHEFDGWESTAVQLITSTVHGKHGSAAVVSECPKCFKKSWVHQDFSLFSEWHRAYNPEVKAAANKAHDGRHLESLHRFADSLCASCQHLRKLDCDTLPIVECTYGKDESVPKGQKFYYHSCFTETDCPKFLARPQKK